MAKKKGDFTLKDIVGTDKLDVEGFFREFLRGNSQEMDSIIIVFRDKAGYIGFHATDDDAIVQTGLLVLGQHVVQTKGEDCGEA